MNTHFHLLGALDFVEKFNINTHIGVKVLAVTIALIFYWDKL